MAAVDPVNAYRQNVRFLCRCCMISIFVASLLSFPGCSRTDDTWWHARAQGVLRVGMDASFPPFEWIATDGSLVGLDVDLAREIGRRLDLDVQFVANLPYDGLYDALTIERVDAIISALVIDPNRMSDFAYSVSYFDAGPILVVRPDSDIMGVEDLAGRTLAVSFGSQADQEARRWSRRRPTLSLSHFGSAAEAMAAVAVAEADAALVDHVSALVASTAESRLSVVGDPVLPQPYAVAVRDESGLLLREINRVLRDMQEDGMMGEITEKWLQTPRSSGLSADINPMSFPPRAAPDVHGIRTCTATY